MNFEIPQFFSVGGLDYKILHEESMRYGEEYGHWNGTTCTIHIAETAGGEKLTEERKQQTFFHELIHAVLDAIGEDDLNDNERFVDALSSALYQTIKTMK